MSKANKTGFAIAIAWPQTWCKQANAWYDKILYPLGINKFHFYKAGHAALVLINKNDGKCHYFDFGRYHAPYGYGRARGEYTDHDLKMNIEAHFDTNKRQIQNFTEILQSLQHNMACHGNGKLYASYAEIHFEKAFEKAMLLQQKSPIIYGPFVWGGTNCSRFVHTVIQAGKPGLFKQFRLRFFNPLTPTPISNVNALNHKQCISEKQAWKPFYPQRKLNREERKSTLHQPQAENDMHWIAGEGAGSFFRFKQLDNNKYLISRISPEGSIECESMFQIPDNTSFDIEKPFKLQYLSHCAEVKIEQNQKTILFKAIEKGDVSINPKTKHQNNSLLRFEV